MIGSPRKQDLALNGLGEHHKSVPIRSLCSRELFFGNLIAKESMKAKIHVFSESQTVLKDLNASFVESKLKQSCRNALQRLCQTGVGTGTV